MYNLRPYQQDVFDKIKIEFSKKNKKVLILAATGFGKTILAHEIAKNDLFIKNRVLFTTHRIQLAEQTFNKFIDLKPELLQGKNKLKNENAPLIIATLQTLQKNEIPPPRVIIIDECHYGYESNLIQQLFTKFPDAFFIGLSATPVNNKDELLEGWDEILDDYQTKDLIEINALVPFKCFAPTSINLANVRKSNKNEFIEADLEAEIKRLNINDTVVSNYIKIGEKRNFIAFCTTKKQCYDLQVAFNKIGIFTSVIVADTSATDRNNSFLELQNNLIDGLISVEILTAGFDMPQISCVIFATATAQWKKYVQCAGRGIRTYDETKIDCIVLDFCNNIELHGMPDERKVFRFGKKISKVIDRELKLDLLSEAKIDKKEITVEKQLFLKSIGSVLDLYENKIYTKESDLQNDVNLFLKKTNYFWWRQNSGKAFMQGGWVNFASKNGLPDNTVFYKKSSLYFGLELKLKTGTFTANQKETLPEMTQNNILFFIIESVFDVYLAIEHIEKNIKFENNVMQIDYNIYNYSERQKKLREKIC